LPDFRCFALNCTRRFANFPQKLDIIPPFRLSVGNTFRKRLYLAAFSSLKTAPLPPFSRSSALVQFGFCPPRFSSSLSMLLHWRKNPCSTFDQLPGGTLLPRDAAFGGIPLLLFLPLSCPPVKLFSILFKTWPFTAVFLRLCDPGRTLLYPLVCGLSNLGPAARLRHYHAFYLRSPPQACFSFVPQILACDLRLVWQLIISRRCFPAASSSLFFIAVVGS